MIDKLTKIFKAVLIAQVFILALVAGFRYLTPNLYAAVYRAHNSTAPESFIITVTTIDFVKEDGTQVSVWQGTEDVDLIGLASLASVKTFNVDVPSGTYKQFGIHMKRDVKIKGSVTLQNGGGTFYTKAAHTGFATAPAELETLAVAGQTMDVQSFARDFNPRLRVGASGVSLSSVNILIDAEEFLTYYNGTGNAPNGGTTGTAAMMLPNYLPVAITFGAPAKKEVYTYGPTAQEGGRLTILYDSNDNPVSASARASYVNDQGNGFSLTGWLMGGTGAAEILDFVTKNNDGTIAVKMYDQIAMAYMGQTQNSDFKLFANFKRTAVGAPQETGSYTNRAGVSNSYYATRKE